jgi:hypothetical protein
MNDGLPCSKCYGVFTYGAELLQLHCTVMLEELLGILKTSQMTGRLAGYRDKYGGSLGHSASVFARFNLIRSAAVLVAELCEPNEWIRPKYGWWTDVEGETARAS